MSDLYTPEAEGVLQADAVTVALIKEYREAKRAQEAAEARTKELRDAVLARFSQRNARVFMSGDTKLATVSSVRRETLDRGLVAKLAPATFQKALKVTETTRLNLGK